MFYDFPTITDISQVRDAIKGKEEFIEAERDGYTVFNYLVRFESTFPKVCSELDAILRECRGITFDSFGKVIDIRNNNYSISLEFDILYNN